ncbi:hypothetical protein [Desulfovibrio sp. SGI.169]|uniref:hypothetical protein n=1 Tax=Desulfovibrio sp. SGI.169 TaxID=3420561 RepID=UPI003D05ED92
MSQINFEKLNEELLDQLERLGNVKLNGEALQKEIARSRMMSLKVEIMQLVRQNELLLQRIRAEAPMLPLRAPDLERSFQAQRACLESLLRALDQSTPQPAA